MRTKKARNEVIKGRIERLKTHEDFNLFEDDNFIGGSYTMGAKKVVTLYKKGKTKPVLNYYVMDQAEAARLIAEQVESHEQHEKDKKERKLRDKKNTLQKGDILYSSWGYDQTNIDFYQVKELRGQQSVIIQRIAGEVVEYTGWCSVMVTAKKDHFLKGSKPRLKRVRNDAITLNTYSSAWLWDGEPKNQTSYA